MRSLLNSILTIMVCSLAACSEPQETPVSIDPTMTYGAFEDASKNPGANIIHDGDWTIVSRTEKGNRVYWFVAPDMNKVSPALYKKTIRGDDKGGRETVIVSNCEAPKQVCDNLMVEFKTLSEKYK